MKTLTCDVCKKKLEDPVAGQNYFHYAHRELCENCKDDLEHLIKPVVRTQSPFNYGWYDSLLKDSIEKAIQKGKF
jgi:hypothetical protein